MASIHEHLIVSATVLRQAGNDNAPGDARRLLAGVLDIDQATLISMSNEPLDEIAQGRFKKFVCQRAKGKPVHRILGFREFYGRDFILNDAALEPRPETELLVDAVLSDRKSKVRNTRFCEIGAGSGAICVTLLAELPGSHGVATDISNEALQCVGQNGDIHGVSNQLELMETDCLQGIEGPFEFIVSNPPYIPSIEIAALSKEVREYDPLAALDGGTDGLAIYRKIFEQAQALLNPGGRLYLETGYDQHEDLEKLAGEGGWRLVRKLMDLSDLPRVMVFEPPDVRP